MSKSRTTAESLSLQQQCGAADLNGCCIRTGDGGSESTICPEQPPLSDSSTSELSRCNSAEFTASDRVTSGETATRPSESQPQCPQGHWVRVVAFAALSSLSLSTVYRRVRDGSLITAQPGGKGRTILIASDSLERLNSEKQADVSSATPNSHDPEELRNPSPTSDSPLPAEVTPKTRRGPRPKWQQGLH